MTCDISLLRHTVCGTFATGFCVWIFLNRESESGNRGDKYNFVQLLLRKNGKDLEYLQHGKYPNIYVHVVHFATITQASTSV